MANEHDKRYKKLFSHPTLIRQLLTSFVQEDFVRGLDFSTLERLDKSFITENFKEKESDLIYRIEFNTKPVYIYLLLEFQSTMDRCMALRILRYITEFYEYLVYVKKEKTPLPAVFPLLLYNGDGAWTAPTDIRDLIRSDIPGSYIPGFNYYKLIENELSPEVLKKIRGVVSAVFYVENSNLDDLGDHFPDVIKMLEAEQPELIDLFRKWLNNILGNEAGEFDTPLTNLQEVQSMFATSLKEHDKKLLEKGKKEEKIETAKKMLEDGLSAEKISFYTGLTISEVTKLAGEK